MYNFSKYNKGPTPRANPDYSVLFWDVIYKAPYFIGNIDNF